MYIMKMRMWIIIMINNMRMINNIRMRMVGIFGWRVIECYSGAVVVVVFVTIIINFNVASIDIGAVVVIFVTSWQASPTFNNSRL